MLNPDLILNRFARIELHSSSGQSDWKYESMPINPGWKDILIFKVHFKSTEKNVQLETGSTTELVRVVSGCVVLVSHKYFQTLYQNTFLNSLVAMSCGGSTSNNNSYIVQSSTTSLTSPCTYTVCPCSTDICRIRYDFTTNTLAAPVLQTASAPGTGLEESHAIGDCTTDQMSITSPGKVGSPIICGTNTDQHSKLAFEIPNFHQLTSTYYYSDC